MYGRSVGRSSPLLDVFRLATSWERAISEQSAVAARSWKAKAVELSQSTKPFFIGLVESAEGQWKNSGYAGKFGKLIRGWKSTMRTRMTWRLLTFLSLAALLIHASAQPASREAKNMQADTSECIQVVQ